MLRFIGAAILIAPTAACSQPTGDPNLVREVAAQVKQDCLSAKSQAPNAAFAHHLERLCDCADRKILASQAKDAAITSADLDRAVQGAIKECDAELGGVADAEDYRATGVQPPPSSPAH